MVVEGTVQNGVVVLDLPGKLADGARVKVILEEQPPAGESLRDMLLRFAGTCHGLPSDMAEQHDHYIHGTPKR